MKSSTHLSVILCGLIAIAVSACSHDTNDATSGGGGGGGGGGDGAAVALYQADFADLANLDDAPFAAYDRANAGLARQVFGTADGAGVRNYLKERTTYFVAKSDVSVSPDGLYNMTAGNDFMVPGLDAVVTVASNIGAALWLEEQVIGRPVTISVNGGAPIAVNSTRVGLVVLGEGYSSHETELYRQAAIVHEARHSDCTGGLTQADVQTMKAALQNRDINGYIKAAKRCAHTHAICPFTHPYAGYPACDDESWGAYTIGGLFAEAATYQIKDNVRKSLGDYIAQDAKSRVLVSRTGSPDMSSSGLEN